MFHGLVYGRLRIECNGIAEAQPLSGTPYWHRAFLIREGELPGIDSLCPVERNRAAGRVATTFNGE